MIEQLQPYNAGNDPYDSPLMALKTFTKIHKHRNLLLAALGAREAPADLNVFEIDGVTYSDGLPYSKNRLISTRIWPFRC